MEYMVKVEPEDGRRGGWIIRYFDWAGPGTPIQEHSITFTDNDDGTFSGRLDTLGPECCLSCTVTRGVSIDVSVAPDAPITFKPGETWAVTVAAGDEPQHQRTICFAVGG